MAEEIALHFSKYQAAGNDFIMLDGRQGRVPTLSTKQITELCDRHFGIGADGLLILTTNELFDFEMLYWNADGSVASFCGNGGRAMVAFARELGLPAKNGTYAFQAGDGAHQGSVLPDGRVQISMKDVQDYQWMGQDLFINTGVPHLVHWLQDKELDTKTLGARLRFDKRFAPEGTNVTFIRSEGTKLLMDTYERGVEDITLACGTGVVAATLASAVGQGLNIAGSYSQEVLTGAGMPLTVKYDLGANGFHNIYLIGGATRVFQGTVYISAS